VPNIKKAPQRRVFQATGGGGRGKIPTQHEKRERVRVLRVWTTNGRWEGGGETGRTRKMRNRFAFFVFGQRIAAEHEKCATNGAFFVFGRWEGGGETGRGCWWLREGGGGGKIPTKHKKRECFRVFRVWTKNNCRK